MRTTSAETAGRPAAVVVGLNINGLGTVRALGRQGIPVIAITSASGEPSEFTRFAVRKVRRPDLKASDDAVVAALLELAPTLQGPAVVFPSGDLYLQGISEHRDELAAHYLFPFPDRETVRLVGDKVRFYRFCQEHGFPIPRTWFPSGPDDIPAIARDVAYPCVVKPSVAGAKWRQRGFKLLPARSPDELAAQYRLAHEVWPSHIIQEVTPGPDSALHFSLTYLDGDHAPLAMFTGRKLRQWIPHYGISSMAISELNPEVAALSLDILRALDYTGYGSVEYKRHAVTGQLLMTEVTMRTWYPHALSERLGINLPYLAYCHLHGFDAGPRPTGFEAGVKWIDEEGDFRSALHYWRHGELSLGEWVRSYRGKKKWALFVSDDLRPGLVFAAQLPLLLAQELLGLLLASARRALGRNERRGDGR
jgi:D-aspartate ligase